MSRHSKEDKRDPKPVDRRIIPATTQRVDAQSATQFEMGRGLAGAEAKPFSEGAKRNSPLTGAGKQTRLPATREQNLVCGRRNAGREDGAENKQNN